MTNDEFLRHVGLYTPHRSAWARRKRREYLMQTIERRRTENEIMLGPGGLDFEIAVLKKQIYGKLKRQQKTEWYKKNTNGGHLSDEQIEQARNVDIRTLLESSRRGRYRCISPEHEDKNPSASVSVKLNILKCFGCDKSWDSIQVMRELYGLKFSEAVRGLLTF